MTDPELVWLLSIVSERSPVERRLLYQEIVKYSWNDETYDYMSDRVGYALNTIKQEHAIAIWRMLSEYFNTRITKKNLKLTVRTLYRDAYGVAEPRASFSRDPAFNKTTRNRGLTIERSPFCDVGRIQSDEYFFNREEIFQDIIYHLKSHWNISLVGEQKIGKSSLLLKICRAAPALLGLNIRQFIYLNMELIHNENILFQQICKAIDIETCRGYDLIEATQGNKYILCIDEIEKMSKFCKLSINNKSHNSILH